MVHWYDKKRAKVFIIFYLNSRNLNKKIMKTLAFFYYIYRALWLALTSPPPTDLALNQLLCITLRTQITPIGPLWCQYQRYSSTMTIINSFRPMGSERSMMVHFLIAFLCQEETLIAMESKSLLPPMNMPIQPLDLQVLN